MTLPGRQRGPWSALLTMALVLAACSDGAEEIGTVAEAGTLVRAVLVKDTLLARPISASGTVAPKEELALSFKVGGVVDRIHVDPGDEVRAGQLLATLQLREVDAGVARARSVADKARRDLARAQRLYSDSVMTLVQLEDAETAAQVARADLETASFNRRYATIVAGSSGTVLGREVEPGETVAPGGTVLVVGSHARGSVVRVGLPDRDLVLVHTGDTAIARFDAFPGRSFRGRVSQVAAAADAGTGTYAVEVALDGGDELPAGMVAKVDIRPRALVRTSLVPIEAILEADGDQATVYAVSRDGRRAVRRRVTVAFIDGDRAAIADGLDGIVAVLTDGAAYVDDGGTLRVRP